MIKNINKKFLVENKSIIIAVILLLIFTFAFKDKKETVQQVLSGEVDVVFTEKGFYPNDLNILKGTKVNFINKSESSFWPASDLHPTHTIYPEFDSLEEIPAGAKWSFIFNREGEWRFHDHLNSQFVGVIRVFSESKDFLISRGCDKEGLTESAKLGCLRDEIKKISNEEGIIKALERLDSGFRSDEVFSRNCHALAHVIGEEAYIQFTNGQEFNVNEKVTYCGYGFYHGFMERLFLMENDFTKARFFCEYLESKTLGGRGGGGALACFHGVGHGFVDGAEKKAWGDEEALITPALILCDKIAITEQEQYRCYSGAFNSLSIAYSAQQYGLKLDEKDPLWFCREQKEERYKLGCYTDMMVALMTLTNDDLLEASKYIYDMDPKYVDRTMYTLSSLSVRQRLNTSNFDDVIDICHKMPTESLLTQCLKGFAGGLMEFGEPTEEYIKANIYCSSKKLKEGEKMECFESVIDYASFAYIKERLKKACEGIPEEYKSEQTKRNCLLSQK
jgi:hypothetical protein